MNPAGALDAAAEPDTASGVIEATGRTVLPFTL